MAPTPSGERASRPHGDDGASPSAPEGPIGALVAVILAGGRSSRFGSDKTLAVLDGLPLLGHVLRAVPDGVPCVVVGPRPPEDVPGARPGWARRTPAPRWMLERDRFGGPAVALASALSDAGALAGRPRAGGDPVDDAVLVLAADQPHVAPAVQALITARHHHPGPDGWIVVDGTGAPRPLPVLCRREPLMAALEAAGAVEGGAPDGAGSGGRGPSLRRVLAGLTLHPVPVPPGSLQDVDTADQLTALLAEPPRP